MADFVKEVVHRRIRREEDGVQNEREHGEDERELNHHREVNRPCLMPMRDAVPRGIF
jgi:hypothetical protein